jgi:lipid-A-disaccharide synthase-like uncharacterized protein
MSESAASPVAPAVLEYGVPPAGHGFRWLDTLGWAAYLGCSWTWCIGMFLPVLLIRDYGVRGWWAFAIPNVIGAAAMGWVLRTREQSESAMATHRFAIRAFSWITVTFHVFFVLWITSWFMKDSRVPPLFWPIVVAGPFLIVYLLAGRRSDRVVTMGVLLLSVIIGCVGIGSGWLPHVVNTAVGLRQSSVGFWCLAPIMIFGFLFCPYLDQTFYRARQGMESLPARWGFGIGFGIFFAAMIVMTMCYSGWLTKENGIPALLLVHLLAQSGITMALHVRDATGHANRELDLQTLLKSVAALIAGIAVFEIMAYGPELGYRLFMGFYGLPFPTYVLICMKPWRPQSQPLSARGLGFFFGAVVLAAPAFLVGVSGYNAVAFVIGIAIVLTAALLEGRGAGFRRQLD